MFFLLQLFSCKSNEEAIELNILKTDKPIILKYSKAHNKIFQIRIPFGLQIYNNSIENRKMGSIHYEYSHHTHGSSTLVYRKDDFKRISSRKDFKLIPFIENDYIIYTVHRIDSTSKTQNKLKPYLDKFIENKQDSLLVGTVSDFRKKNKVFFDALVKGDSIGIRVILGYGPEKSIYVNRSNGNGSYKMPVRDILSQQINVPLKWP